MRFLKQLSRKTLLLVILAFSTLALLTGTAFAVQGTVPATASESGEEELALVAQGTAPAATNGSGEEELATLASNKTNVAQIGSKYYTSLKDAFSAVKKDETIVMIADCEISHININVTCTLDLNGHTVKKPGEGLFYSDYALWLDNNNITFTMKDSAGGGQLVSESGGVIADSDGSTFVLESGLIECDTYVAWSERVSCVSLSHDKARFIMNGGTLHNAKGHALTLLDRQTFVDMQKTEVEINGGTISSGDWAAIYIYQSRLSKITINNGTIKSDNAYAISSNYNPGMGNVVIINGGVFEGHPSSTNQDYYTDTSHVTYTLRGGIFYHEPVASTLDEGYTSYKITSSPRYGWYEVRKKIITVTFDPNGGTLTGEASQSVEYDERITEPSKPTREGYVFLGWTTSKDGDTYYDFGRRVEHDRTIYAKWQQCVAKIGDTYYTTITDAVTASEGGDTITLLANIDFTNESKSCIEVKGKQITLDLAGFSLNSQATQAIYVSHEGSVTLTDSSGKGSVTGGAYGVQVIDDSSFTMEGGSLAGYTYAVKNSDKGTVNIEGGTLTNSSTYVTSTISREGTVAVSGGTFSKTVPVEQCAVGYIPAGDTSGSYTVEPGWKITFDAGSGKLSGDKVVCVAAGKKVSKPRDPTCKGYEFKGWFTDRAHTSEFDFAAAPESDLTLYAKWEGAPAQFTVTFDSNGGKPTFGGQTLKYGEYATNPGTPELDNYTFKGWTSDKEGKEAFDFANTPIFADITLYAQWVKNNVALTRTGSTTYYDNLQDALDAAQDGDTLVLLDNLTLGDSAVMSDKMLTLDLNGHTLTGADSLDPVMYVSGALTLSDSATGGCIKSTIADDPLSSVILLMDGSSLNLTGGSIQSASGTGIWTIKNANVNIEGGSITTAQEAVAVVDGSELSVKSGTLTSTNSNAVNAFSDGVKVSVEGGTFTSAAGFYSDISANEDDANAVNISAGIFSFAVPIEQCAEGYVPVALGTSPETYSVAKGWAVSFDANGGTLPESITTQYVKDGEKATAPADEPTPATGYEFKGWSLEPVGGEIYDFDKAVTESITLYAQYTPIEYTITYVLDGGIDPGNPATYTIETESFELKESTKTGYIFLGWYNGEEQVEAIPQGSTGNLKLTAKWAKGVISVTDSEGKTTYYDDLQKAFDAATNGSTVKLYVDLTLKDAAKFSGKGLVLNLNGHAVSTTGATAIELTNAQLVVGDNSADKSGSITGASYAVKANQSSVAVMSGSLKATSGGAALYVEGSESAEAGTYYVGVSGGTIDGGTGTGIQLASKGIELDIDDGAISGATTMVNADASNELVVEGGTFTSTSDPCIATPESTTGFVSAGTFNHPVPLAQCAEGYIPATKTDEQGNTYYTVERGSYVATVTDTEGNVTNYTTLQAAVDAAQSGSTITLLQDVTECVRFPWFDLKDESPYHSLTLELNGHTISGVGNTSYTLWLRGGNEVTIRDSVGTGKVVNYVEYAVNQSAQTRLIVEGGTYEGSNYGLELTTGDGKIGHDAEAIVKGGSITGKYAGVRLCAGASINNIGTSLTVTGGNISGAVAVTSEKYAFGEQTPNKISVSGGNLTATDTSATKEIVDEAATESVAITKFVTGGIFAHEIPAEQVAEGYQCVAVEDGYTVAPITCTATFDANGGAFASGEPQTQQTVGYKETVSTPEAPVREGYTFKEWTTDQEGTTPFDFATQLTGSITLYAQWEENMPTKVEKPDMKAVSGLVYNGKEQTGVAVVESQYYEVSEVTATNAGYYTAKVSLIDPTKYQWADGTTDDLTLEWMIAPKAVTITVHDASMIVGDPEPEYSGEVTGVVDGDNLMIDYFLDPQADTKVPGTYAIHAGWNVENPNYEVTSNDGTLTVSEDPAPTKLTVTFEANGGTLSGDAHQTVEKGKKATKPSNPTREGYSFDGWYTAPEGGEEYTFTEPLEDNLILYAQWTKQATVVEFPEIGENVFEYNGAKQTIGIPKSDYYIIEGEESGKNADVYTAVVKLKEGCVWADGTTDNYYVFWLISQKHATIDVDDATMVAGAEVPKLTGTVTGVCDGDDLQVAYKLEDDADTTKAGTYKIQATFSDEQSNYIVAITEGTLTVTKAPATTYQVIFNANGGTIEGQSGMAVEVKAGECVVEPETPVRDGYTFDGWYTAEEGGEKFDFATAINANTSLYAHWTKKAEPTPGPTPVNPGNKGNGGSGKELPQTGDTTNAAAIAALGIAGVAIVGTGLALNKRKK